MSTNTVESLTFLFSWCNYVALAPQYLGLMRFYVFSPFRSCILGDLRPSVKKYLHFLVCLLQWPTRSTRSCFEYTPYISPVAASGFPYQLLLCLDLLLTLHLSMSLSLPPPPPTYLIPLFISSSLYHPLFLLCTFACIEWI